MNQKKSSNVTVLQRNMQLLSRLCPYLLLARYLKKKKMSLSKKYTTVDLEFYLHTGSCSCSISLKTSVYKCTSFSVTDINCLYKSHIQSIYNLTRHIVMRQSLIKLEDIIGDNKHTTQREDENYIWAVHQKGLRIRKSFLRYRI